MNFFYSHPVPTKLYEGFGDKSNHRNYVMNLYLHLYNFVQVVFL